MIKSVNMEQWFCKYGTVQTMIFFTFVYPVMLYIALLSVQLNILYYI